MRIVNRHLARLIERRAITSSSAILCASPGIADLLRRAYPDATPKIHEVINGFDAVQERRSSETGGALSVLFAGVLYMNRNPFPFLEALERLLAQPTVDRTRIRVDFVGRCDAYAGVRLTDWLSGKFAAEVVHLNPSVPERELVPFMRRATVLLNLAQGQPRQIPAKTFEQLASGSEIISICERESDTGRVLLKIPGVFRLEPGDANGLDSALRDLYQRHVIDGRISPPPEESIARFSRRSQTQLFMEVFRAAAPIDAGLDTSTPKPARRDA